MSFSRIVLREAMIAGLLCSLPPAFGDSIEGILQGSVVMRDGSAPPFTVGIQRICSDESGSKPGPLTNKKGEYIWRMDFDPSYTRRCYLIASKDGYTSTEVDISTINPVMDHNIKVEPLVLTVTPSRMADPYSISLETDPGIPSKGIHAWNAAITAIAARDVQEAMKQLQAVVAVAPKSAAAWHALGVMYDRQRMLPAAHDAYQRAIEADPKMLEPYLTLAQLDLFVEDWDGAIKVSNALIKVDKKNTCPEIYLHRAVAQYKLKDVAGAEIGVEEVIRKDPKHAIPRAEFVLGRILESKGDLNGARDHITKYLDLDPKTPDAVAIRLHLENLGQSDQDQVEPLLELLNVRAKGTALVER